MAKMRGLLRRQAHDFINLPRVKYLEFKTGPRAGRYNTPQLRKERLTGVKPSAQDVARMRRDFEASGGPRDRFLDTARARATVTELQALGWTDEEIRKFRAGGSPPEGYAVHHIRPLQGGGTNDQDNLVLIKNDPDHDLITAQQNAVLRRIPAGHPMDDVDVPVTPPGHLTWPQPGARAHRQ